MRGKLSQLKRIESFLKLIPGKMKSHSSKHGSLAYKLPVQYQSGCQL